MNLSATGTLSFTTLTLLLNVLTQAAPIQPKDLPPLVPGTLDWDWVGNTHSDFKVGDGNGDGRWVQNGIDEMEVTLDGTVIVGTVWDEGGRSIGLYKDGTVNRSCLGKKNRGGGHHNGGWGTSNQAMTVSGDEILLASADGEFFRFSWKVGDIDSARYVDAFEHGFGDVERDKKTAVPVIGMNARDGRVAVLLKDGRIEVRDQKTWAVQTSFSKTGALDLCWGRAGKLWIATPSEVIEFSPEGKPTGRVVSDAGRPSAVAMAPDGRLVICDDGDRQQVRFYQVDTEIPKLLGVFGKEGGIRAGTPGIVAPDKLMRPAGANFDAAGNLYVGMRYDEKAGGCILRSYDPKGALRWEQACHLFSEAWDIDGDAAGNLTAHSFRATFSKPAGAKRGDWHWDAVTLDSLHQVEDPRYRDSADGWPGAVLQASTTVRELDGVRYFFCWGSGGNSPIEVFKTEQDGKLAKHVLTHGQRGPWAYEVDDVGSIWWDESQTTLVRQAFSKGTWGEPQRFPMPPGITQMDRIKYDAKQDRLYVSGYGPDAPKPNGEWGLMGRLLMRVDGFTRGTPKVVWTNAKLNLDDEGLPPKAMTWAGDYLFTAACKPTASLGGQIYVYRITDGSFVGRISAPTEIAAQSGWVDLSHGLLARLLPDGRYAIAQEDNWHAKVIVHLWKPQP